MLVKLFWFNARAACVVAAAPDLIPCACCPYPHLQRNAAAHAQFDRLRIKYEQESSSFHEQLAELKQQVGAQVVACSATLTRIRSFSLAMQQLQLPKLR